MRMNLARPMAQKRQQTIPYERNADLQSPAAQNNLSKEVVMSQEYEDSEHALQLMRAHNKMLTKVSAWAKCLTVTCGAIISKNVFLNRRFFKITRPSSFVRTDNWVLYNLNFKAVLLQFLKFFPGVKSPIHPRHNKTYVHTFIVDPKYLLEFCVAVQVRQNPASQH